MAAAYFTSIHRVFLVLWLARGTDRRLISQTPEDTRSRRRASELVSGDAAAGGGPRVNSHFLRGTGKPLTVRRLFSVILQALPCQPIKESATAFPQFFGHGRKWGFGFGLMNASHARKQRLT